MISPNVACVNEYGSFKDVVYGEAVFGIKLQLQIARLLNVIRDRNIAARANGAVEPSTKSVGTTPIETTLKGQVFRVAVRHANSDKLTHDEPRFVAKVKVLPDVETASDVLGVRHAKQFMIALLVFGDEFGLVEQGDQITTRFKIGADIEEAAFLVDALGVVDNGIPSTEQEVAGVLSFFSLAGFSVNIGLECRVDVGVFYAI